MKKLNIVILLTLFSSGAFAQFNKGRMLVGGTLGFNTQKQKTKSNGNTDVYGNQITFSLEPQFGYFIIDNLAVGSGLNVSLSKFKEDSGDEYQYSTSKIQIAPFVRYYIKPGVFFQGTYRIGPQTIKYGSSGDLDKTKATASGWALAAGYALFLNDHVAVEPMLGYGMDVTKYKADGNSNEYKGISSGVFFRIGFQIYLGDKK